MSLRHLAAVAPLVFCLAVAGCDAAHKRDDSPRTDAERDVSSASEWTAGIIDRPKPGAPAAMLVAVRTGIHDGFDRVVFEFDQRVPGFHIEYIDQPVRTCGSGNVTQMADDGWLEVRMSPAKAHTEAGVPTVAERERAPKLPELSELKMTCDFEAVMTWVLGVESPNRYRVRESSNPPRIVVEVQH